MFTWLKHSCRSWVFSETTLFNSRCEFSNYTRTPISITRNRINPDRPTYTKLQALWDRKPPLRQLIPQNSCRLALSRCGKNSVNIPGSESWIRISTKVERFVAMVTSHPSKISYEFIDNFLSYPADRQTDSHAHTQRQKHNLLGGGNKATSGKLCLRAN